MDFQKKVMVASGETVPKHSRVGESQSYGEVENGIRIFQEQLRTLKDHLEAIAKLGVSMRYAVIPWLLQWASVTLNRYAVHKSGIASYQRTTGKKSIRPAATFCEKALPVHAAENRTPQERKRRTEAQRGILA